MYNMCAISRQNIKKTEVTINSIFEEGFIHFLMLN